MKIICLPILIIFSLLLATGCHISKHTEKSSIDKDSLTIANLQRDIEDKEKEISYLQNKITQLEYLGVDMQPCPPQMNMDSLRRVLIESNCSPGQIEALMRKLQQAETIIKRQADGSLEIRGQVARLTQTKSSLEETVISQQKEITRLQKELASSKTEVNTDEKKSAKEVDRWYIPWWIWPLMAIAVVASWYLKGWTISRGEAFADAKGIFIRKPQK